LVLKKKDRFFAGGLLLIMAISLAAVTQKWAIAYLAAAIFLAAVIIEVSLLTGYAFASLSWPSTPSHQVQAFVDEQDDSRRDSKSYSLKVAYGYSVAGKAFRGRRLRFPFGISMSSTSLFEEARRLNGKTSAPVYFDPSDPRTCTLQTGLSVLDGLALAVFYACSLPVLLVLIYQGVTNVV